MIKRISRFARERLHAATISRWGWWPAELPALLQPRGRSARLAAPRVAYYLWHFPVLSQTFVRREIEALRKHGISLEVFAEAAEDVDLLDERDRGLLTTTTYLLPIDPQRLSRYQRLKCRFYISHYRARLSERLRLNFRRAQICE